MLVCSFYTVCSSVCCVVAPCLFLCFVDLAVLALSPSQYGTGRRSSGDTLSCIGEDDEFAQSPPTSQSTSPIPAGAAGPRRYSKILDDMSRPSASPSAASISSPALPRVRRFSASGSHALQIPGSAQLLAQHPLSRVGPSPSLQEIPLASSEVHVRGSVSPQPTGVHGRTASASAATTSSPHVAVSSTASSGSTGVTPATTGAGRISVSSSASSSHSAAASQSAFSSSSSSSPAAAAATAGASSASYSPQMSSRRRLSVPAVEYSKKRLQQVSKDRIPGQVRAINGWFSVSTTSGKVQRPQRNERLSLTSSFV